MIRCLIVSLILLFSLQLFGQKSWVIEFKSENLAKEYLNQRDLDVVYNKKLMKSSPVYQVDFLSDVTADDLAKEINILRITPNVEVKYREIPDDPNYEEQWSLPLIGAEEAWNEVNHGFTSLGNEIVIAVMEEFIDIFHEDIINNIWVNQAEIPGDGLDNDLNGYIDDYYGLHIDSETDQHPKGSHGSKVSGIIGAEGNNDLGIAGLNWKIKIMVISGTNNAADIVQGYDYIYEQRKLFNDTWGAEGSFVVATNFSAGISKVFGDNFPIWCNMYDRLGEEGVISVCATDNLTYNVDDEGDMPTTCQSDFLITVTNTDRSDNKYVDAAFGPINVDLGAPGTNTYSSSSNNTYADFTGTSASCPHVSGAIGLLYAVDCDSLANLAHLRPKDAALIMKEALLNNTESVSSMSEITTSGGRLDVFKAMSGLSSLCTQGSPFQREKLEIMTINPNPVKDRFQLKYGFKTFASHRLSIYDSTGKLIYNDEIIPSLFKESVIELDVSFLPQGIYVVRIDDGMDRLSTQFVKLN